MMRSRALPVSYPNVSRDDETQLLKKSKWSDAVSRIVHRPHKEFRPAHIVPSHARDITFPSVSFANLQVFDMRDPHARLHGLTIWNAPHWFTELPQICRHELSS